MNALGHPNCPNFSPNFECIPFSIVHDVQNNMGIVPFPMDAIDPEDNYCKYVHVQTLNHRVRKWIFSVSDAYVRIDVVHHHPSIILPHVNL